MQRRSCSLVHARHPGDVIFTLQAWRIVIKIIIVLPQFSAPVTVCMWIKIRGEAATSGKVFMPIRLIIRIAPKKFPGNPFQ
ncbi:MAG: hypothetical protein A3F73_12385 [Gallionellales bacterium RIFCSPLOWO2_12_FULL_59_22]|nr:MAG: hypothetical protein A3H99_01790 [Gallionellales bacterium RIFCSPLOWO2_02_FULL_59_110]OGT03101.1 MAG: hypothetical protein A2Z65_00510 [Gallionellales bacterium RIFCSPLOWO2_02_58_13]OGT13730.1 MAG: hypothetical protein A3F73_12385 [Gallionellales bacterium RIFCSPLOWO2_12_FULL_59_22]